MIFCLKNKINIKVWKILLILPIMAIIFLIPKSAFADETRIIKVGYYPMENYHAEDESGNIVGYEIDYLNKIAEKTDWQYEYVKIESWSQAVEMLENREIDLLSPSQIVEDRIMRFSFSAMPIGKVYGGIIALNNSKFVYEDFNAFSNMTFGVEEGVSYNKLFLDYARENKFTPKIIKYKNHSALIEALNEGEVDAIIANVIRLSDDMKLIGRFGTSSYYFMFRKDDHELEDALNYALYKIDLEFPNYQNDLNKKYFPIYSKDFLTKEELDYINQLGELTIGCPVNMDPVSYLDEQTGEITGITKDILDIVSERTGLKFKYKELPQGSITYDFLLNEGISIASCVENNDINNSFKGLRLTIPYLNSQKVVVGKRGVFYGKASSLRIAVSTGSQTLSKFIKSQYPNFEVVFYKTVEEAVKAVKKGEADVLLHNQHVVQPYLAKPQFESLAIIPSKEIEDNLCLSLILNTKNDDLKLDDKKLISILNKGIRNVTSDEISSIIISHTTGRPYKFSFNDFLYQYRYAIILIFFIAVMFLAMGIYTIDIKRKNLIILKENEKKLKNITSNINGGVIVLLPDEGLKITYANEGFLELIQYSTKEYNNIVDVSYTMYIHKDDIHIINNILNKVYHHDEKISLRIRIQRKDGTYIPTRFNGTITKNENGDLEMYCVIMDISQEIKMLEKLEFEQKKHNFIVEKSNDIIYEIELEKNKIYVSETFQKVFGWSLPKDIYNMDLQLWADNWRTYSEDIILLKNMFSNTIKNHMDSSCNIRITDNEGIYRWCRVSQYIMRNENDVIKLIIGKIADIDEEVKEKQVLEKKSQLDAMTGLYNKDTFLKLAKHHIEESEGINSALVFLDLDNFKSLNDQLGHMTGDKAIKDASKKLQVIFSSYDLISRFGGDEFCILVKDIPPKTLEDKLAWALEKLCQTYSNEESSITITASIGVAYTFDSGNNLDVLMQCADKALYEVKENGKNQYMVYNDSMGI